MSKSFTKRYLDGVVSDKKIDIQDEGQGAVSGLYFRVTPTNKSWMVRYRSPTELNKAGKKIERKKTIGKYQVMDITAARIKALEILTQVANGVDPYHVLPVDKIKQVTVSDVFEGVYTQLHMPTHKESTAAEKQRQWLQEIKPQIGDLPIDEATERQVMAIVHKKVATSPSMASYIFKTLSHFFGWARSNGYTSNNPIRDMSFHNPSKPRERFLSFDEIKTFYRAYTDTGMSEPMQIILKLLLLTGQRSSEVSGATERELDFDKMLWNIPKERTKNKRPHTVPLTDESARLFKRAIALSRKVKGNSDRYVFPAVSKEKRNTVSGPIQAPAVSRAVKRTFTRIDMESFTPHDLRRSLSTHMNEIGIFPHLVEYIINHVSGSRGGVAGVYNRALPLKEMRRALERWESHVDNIIEGKPISNVVQLHG